MSLKLEEAGLRGSIAKTDMEQLYRAVADGEPQREILQMLYDMFGVTCNLRPPVDELNLARRCQPFGDSRG